jgi:hypothetical protein
VATWGTREPEKEEKKRKEKNTQTESAAQARGAEHLAEVATRIVMVRAIGEGL